MNEENKSANIVLILGIIGIIGVLLTIASDFILIGRANSSFSFLKLGTESMVGFSQWRITIGTFMGVISIPFQMAGLATVYYGLRPGGKFKAGVVVFTTAHALIMAVAFHMSYAFIASGWKLFYETGASDVVGAEMLKRFDYYWRILLIIMTLEVIISSIYFVSMIMKNNTLYPKWMALLNPLAILIYVFLVVMILPYPIGGFIAPAFLNLSTLVFLIFSTTIVYKKLVK